MESLAAHWDHQYRAGRPIWDSDRPATELKRVVAEARIAPCTVLELGCGTGANAVWLARQGFTVTAIDLSETAIAQAEERAAQAGVPVRFLVGDLRKDPKLDGPFDFFVDCGCFGAVQLADVPGYLRALEHLTRPGSLGLVLTGSDREPSDEEGPPEMSEETLHRDFRPLFDILHLRPFHFDPHQGNGKEYPGWSCLLRRR